MLRQVILLTLLVLATPSLSISWDGYDHETGNYIEVDSYDHDGTGEGEVEYYDYESGEYKSGYLDMDSGGSGTLFDYETGEYHDVDMN